MEQTMLSLPYDLTMKDRHTSKLERISRFDAAKAEAGKFVIKNEHDKRKLNEAAQEFEAVFISQMLEHMFAGIETNEVFGGGHAEDIYRSMMVDEYGKIIARSGGIGVADHVLRQLQQTQDVAYHPQEVKK